jgi:hypothetical protein
LPSVLGAREHLANAWRNFRGIWKQQIYQDSGMTALVARFHDAVANSGPPPIPYREVLLTARLMDEIFAQMRRDGSNPTALSGARPLAEMA